MSRVQFGGAVWLLFSLLLGSGGDAADPARSARLPAAPRVLAALPGLETAAPEWTRAAVTDPRVRARIQGRPFRILTVSNEWVRTETGADEERVALVLFASAPRTVLRVQLRAADRKLTNLSTLAGQPAASAAELAEARRRIEAHPSWRARMGGPSELAGGFILPEAPGRTVRFEAWSADRVRCLAVVLLDLSDPAAAPVILPAAVLVGRVANEEEDVR